MTGLPLSADPAASAPARSAAPVWDFDRESSLVRHDPELERLVLDILADSSATYGVAIKELSTERGLLLNPDVEFYAASLFKLPIMYEVFNQWRSGVLRLDEMLVLTPRAAELDLGTLDRAVGDAYSVGQALERMITISDNSTAILLQDRVGPWRANQSVSALGMTHTHLQAERLTTAPRDMLLFFERLARGTAIDPTASAAMVHLLLDQKVNDRLPARLPPGTPVAHKTGNWPGHVHDAGIVYGPRATFIIAVLTAEVDDVAETTATIAELARAVYDYFQGLSATPLPIPLDPQLDYPELPPGRAD